MHELDTADYLLYSPCLTTPSSQGKAPNMTYKWLCLLLGLGLPEQCRQWDGCMHAPSVWDWWHIEDKPTEFTIMLIFMFWMEEINLK